MPIILIENMFSIYFLENVVVVFPKLLSLNQLCTQIDNKQELNFKPEDIFIIISRVCTEGNYKCSLILVVVAYATLSLF